MSWGSCSPPLSPRQTRWLRLIQAWWYNYSWHGSKHKHCTVHFNHGTITVLQYAHIDLIARWFIALQSHTRTTFSFTDNDDSKKACAESTIRPFLRKDFHSIIYLYIWSRSLLSSTRCTRGCLADWLACKRWKGEKSGIYSMSWRWSNKSPRMSQSSGAAVLNRTGGGM